MIVDDYFCISKSFQIDISKLDSKKNYFDVACMVKKDDDLTTLNTKLYKLCEYIFIELNSRFYFNYLSKSI